MNCLMRSNFRFPTMAGGEENFFAWLKGTKEIPGDCNDNFNEDIRAMFLAEEISGQLLEEAIAIENASAELLEFARMI